MIEYQRIVQHTLDNGTVKENRTGIDTLAVPNVHFSHNMSDGFPLLTTKKMAWKWTRIELEGFIKGITDKKWYQDRGCKFWDQWANPQAVDRALQPPGNYSDEYRKEIQSQISDLGPVYGYQWRRFDQPYGPLEEMSKEQPYKPLPHTSQDQLAQIVDKLKNNPNDRRMICSAWNPHQLNKMALPPCHLCFIITHIEGTINLHWTQRSCDLMLGVPCNIASYALLLELLATESRMTAGNLSGMLCDCHIYTNQIDGAREQLDRTPNKLPTLWITGNGDKPFSIWDWTHKDVEIRNYDPHPKIDFGAVAV